MNKQKFLQAVLDISTRRKKHEFVQQLSKARPLPIKYIDVQYQRQKETSR